MIKLDFYDQIFVYLVKCNILKDKYIYFSNNAELMEFIYLRFNVTYRQVEFDNDTIHLNNKLGERFATIGKIISKE